MDFIFKIISRPENEENQKVVEIFIVNIQIKYAD